MGKSIQKKDKKSFESLDKQLEKLNVQNFKVGDFVIGQHGSIYKVGKISLEEFELLSKWSEEKKWSHYGTMEWSRASTEYIKFEKTEEEYLKEAFEMILSGGLEKEENIPSVSTDLVTTHNEHVYDVQKQLQEKRNKIIILERVLERKKDKMHDIVRSLNAQVKEVMKIIGIIELYLGVNEEIVQILEGIPAPLNTALSFRQLVLHMDEEVACTEDDGVDFKNIEKFDEWIRENYKTVLPEEKGIMVLRPRREKKHYCENPLVDATLNEGNFSTYIFIRNGTNLYRIKTNQNIYPYFFPGSGEMDALLNKAEDGKWESDRTDAQDDILRYKRNVLLIQGLLDRTEVLHPLPLGLNLLDPHTYGAHVNFIYDGTDLLDDGKESYFDWLERTNKKIKRGTRIYFTGFKWDEEGRDRMAEIGYQSYSDNRYWAKPPSGLYNIERVEEVETRYGGGKEKRLVFLHKPANTVWTADFDSHDRKRSNTYYLYYDDRCMINYDEANWEQILYYTEDRVERRNYLTMLPVLKGIAVQLKEEWRWERSFRCLLKSQFDCDLTDEVINKAITWWKNKVIYKRPLKSEDAKALRMITGRVRRILKEEK